ncbi:hypothetical protein HK100_001393 [Physocladia obscura]|uniref:Uncharacterized protein n=1 Tax=Physocladia obscura TaxID=109957 RepID=A0AAD5XGD2_9FUNG|nr:hypothetical protein HK100_001393 [Physocladia obscura]
MENIRYITPTRRCPCKIASIFSIAKALILLFVIIPQQPATSSPTNRQSIPTDATSKLNQQCGGLVMNVKNCDPGLFCVSPDGGFFSIFGICKRGAQVDEPCGRIAENQSQITRRNWSGTKNAIFWPWLRDTVVVCAEGLVCSIVSGASGTCQILAAGLPIESNEIDSVDSDVVSTSDGDIATASDSLDVATASAVEGNAVLRNRGRGALCGGPKRLKCTEGLVCRWAGPAPLPYFSSDATMGLGCQADIIARAWEAVDQ